MQLDAYARKRDARSPVAPEAHTCRATFMKPSAVARAYTKKWAKHFKGRPLFRMRSVQPQYII